MRELLAFGLVAASISAADAMSVLVTWGPTKKCFDTKSPPMTVSGVPAGTAKLKITMSDLNNPYPHGGGTVSSQGGPLPYGAFSYKGPCPPDKPHNYQFTVKALDSSGKVLETAKSTKLKFPQ